MTTIWKIQQIQRERLSHHPIHSEKNTSRILMCFYSLSVPAHLCICFDTVGLDSVCNLYLARLVLYQDYLSSS